MVDEARLREVLHTCVAEIIEHLWLPGVHNRTDVTLMSDRVHAKIDTLGDE